MFLLSFSIISQQVYSDTFSKLWGLASYFGRYEQLIYTIEPQIRLLDRSDKYDQTLLNAGLGTFIAPQWQIWLGQTYVNYSTSNTIAEDVENVVQNEYRIWEQVLWRRPFADGLASRTRLEQRRVFQSSEWSLRIRERGYWSVPLNQTVNFVLSDEFFLNIKSAPWVATSFFDQNRLFVGIFYKITPNSGINITYMSQYINRNPQEFNNGLVLNWIYYAF